MTTTTKTPSTYLSPDEPLRGECFAERAGRSSYVVDWRGPVEFRSTEVDRWGVVHFHGDRNQYAVARLLDGRTVRLKRKDLSPTQARAVKALVGKLRVSSPAGSGSSAAYSERYVDASSAADRKPAAASPSTREHAELQVEVGRVLAELTPAAAVERGRAAGAAALADAERACVRCDRVGSVDHDQPSGLCNPCVEQLQGGAPRRMTDAERAEFRASFEAGVDAVATELETERARKRAATSGPAYRCDRCRDKSTRCASCRTRRSAARGALRDRKRDEGQCLDCNAPATTGGRCDKHRAASNASSRQAHARKRAPKQYAYNGLAGCVAQTKSHVSGTLIGIYNAEQAGIDAAAGDRWVVVCEAHSATVSCDTLAAARNQRNSADFCADCREAKARRDDQLAVYALTPAEYRGYECSHCGGKLGRKSWQSNVGVYCRKSCSVMPTSDDDAQR